MDNIALDSKEHRDRLTKGTFVKAQKYPDRVGVIYATPTHPNTWFTVRFEDNGETHTFRPKELTLVKEYTRPAGTTVPAVADKGAVARLKADDALLAEDPLSESDAVKDNDDEASVASSRDDGRRGSSRLRSASMDENGNESGSVNSATMNQSAKAIASKNLIDKKVQLSDGRIGTVLKSGHGFYTIDIDGTNERVMKRKEDLKMYEPSVGNGALGGKGAAVSPNKSAKASPARPLTAAATTTTTTASVVPSAAVTSAPVSVPSAVVKYTPAEPVPAPKEEKPIVEELSAVDEERASKQSRAAMIRAQAEHAERIKEFVARHQRRCFSENRPNLTLWFDEFASDDENNEEKKCALADDFLPNHRCKECKLELGLDWSYCWNLSCKACPAYDANANHPSSLYDKEKKLAVFASESIRRLNGKGGNNVVDKSPIEKLVAFDSEATVYYLGRQSDKDGGNGNPSESHLDYSWRRDSERAGAGVSLKRKREGEGDGANKRAHTEVAVKTE